MSRFVWMGAPPPRSRAGERIPNRRARMWVPALLAYTTDLVVTLLHQPGSYWAGDLDSVREANPVFRWLLGQSPVAFLVVAGVWAITFSLILRGWRHPFAYVLALLLTLGHTLGAGTWLIQYGPPGWVAAVGLLILAERLLTWSSRPPTPEPK